MRDHNHFVELCKCGAVISQCRCFNKAKLVKVGICDKCKNPSVAQQAEAAVSNTAK